MWCECDLSEIPLSDTEFVEPHDACPFCGERRTDRLAWRKRTRIECRSCGLQYERRVEQLVSSLGS